MKRFWLLLLALVLPLQMSWAAVHFCDTDLPNAASSGAPSAQGHAKDHAQHQERDHARESAKAAEGQAVEALADACCGAAHGCHGLHSLMAAQDAANGAVASGAGLTGAAVRLVTSAFNTRHERPQWSAA